MGFLGVGRRLEFVMVGERFWNYMDKVKVVCGLKKC